MIHGTLRAMALCAAFLLMLPLDFQCLAQIKEKYDSIYIQSVTDSVNTFIKKHPNKFKPSNHRFKAIPYFGLSYSEEDNFGASIGAVGFYKNGIDTLTPQSITSIISGASINKSFFGTIKGRHYTPKGKFLIDYTFRFVYNNRYFWGLGYENGDNQENKSTYIGINGKIRTDFLFKPTLHITTGPFVGFDYYSSSDFTKIELIEGNQLFSRSVNLGLNFTYNSKDKETIPTKGLYIEFEQTFYPGLFFDIRPYYRTFLIADYYFSAWQGGVFALDVLFDFNYGDSPWFQWPQLGGNKRMRGYYQGKYRDRNMISAQLEIRQRIYKNHGIALWGGGGNIFHSFSEFDIKETLPTFGAGYRFEFLGMLLSIDAGFGKDGQYAVIAGVNQTF